MKAALLNHAFLRFLIVGVFAAIIHLGLVVILVELLAFKPLLANIFGFACAFQASYWGHATFTFQGHSATHLRATLKLLTLQLINLMINEYLFYFFLSLHIPYALALFLVLAIMPVFTFTISKYFIFV